MRAPESQNNVPTQLPLRLKEIEMFYNGSIQQVSDFIIAKSWTYPRESINEIGKLEKHFWKNNPSDEFLEHSTKRQSIAIEAVLTLTLQAPKNRHVLAYT